MNFVRYAGDGIIMVVSEIVARRVMRSISMYIEEKLGLKIKITKSKIDKPKGLKYLGFGLYYDAQAR